MGRPKIPLKQRYQSYINEFGKDILKTNGQKLFCIPCDTVINNAELRTPSRKDPPKATYKENPPTTTIFARINPEQWGDEQTIQVQHGYAYNVYRSRYSYIQDKPSYSKTDFGQVDRDEHSGRIDSEKELSSQSLR